MKPNAFYKEVYQLVRSVPAGRVTTYGAVSAAAGKLHGARQVGRALKTAPYEEKLPAHRVLNSKGDLAPGEVFGHGIQRQMLQQEGICFTKEGRVPLRTYFFMPVKK